MRDGGEDDLAPVIPLFGKAAPAVPAESGGPWNNTWAAESTRRSDPDDEPASDERELAEGILLRKLRTRSLSVSEARAVVAAYDLDDGAVESVIETFLGRGYLDDVKLADQLIHSAVDRKGQGRVMVAQALAKRGIPRDLIDAALAGLPDDEYERALEYARSKARSMRGLERDVALRRLSGQLARRGYGGQSFEAARHALDEVAPGARPVRGIRPGVRFEP